MLRAYVAISLTLAGATRCQSSATPVARGATNGACEARLIGAEQLAKSPDVRYRLEGRTFADVQVTVLRLPAPNDQLAVAAVTWAAPSGGVLVLLACDGHVHAVVPSGYVDSMAVVTTPASMPAMLRTESQVGGATGYSARVVAFWAVADGKLTKSYAGFVSEEWSGNSDEVFRESATIDLTPVGAIERRLVASSGARTPSDSVSARIAGTFPWDPLTKTFLVRQPQSTRYK